MAIVKIELKDNNMSKGQVYNGVLLGDSGRFESLGREETTTLTVRLPIRLANEIREIPNRQDWLREVLSKAIEERKQKPD